MGILNKANKKLKKVNATDLKVMGFVCRVGALLQIAKCMTPGIMNW